MNCSYCGAQLQPGATACANCGAAYTPTPVAADPGKGQGQTSMILGIIGVVSPFVVGTLPGIICAIIAFVLSNKATALSAAAGFENKNAKTGKTLGLIGIIVNAALTVLAIIAFVLYLVLVVGLTALSL